MPKTKKQKRKTNKPAVKVTTKNKPIRRRIPRRRRRAIPAARAKQFKRRFNIRKQGGNSVRVAGRDLIYSIPDDLTSPVQASNVIAVIPANPVYWSGTRVAALATGYQNYRPVKFKVTYVPICAVTQQGNVIGGTIWEDGIPGDNIQQSLRTSNGGFLTQCYTPHTVTVRPKSNLQFNLYRIGGAFDQKSNPFVYIAIAIGCTNASSQRIVPGYFYVTWEYEFKNPIGKVGQYYNSGLTTYSTYTPQMNNTMINLITTGDIPFGAYIDIEDDDGTAITKYNDTEVTVQSTTPVWIFQSVEKATENTRISKLPIVYATMTTTNITITGTRAPITGVVTDFTPVALLYDDEEHSRYEILELTSCNIGEQATQPTFTVINTNKVYTITTQQTFGVYQGTETITVTYKTSNKTMHYRLYYADKQTFTIQPATMKVQKKNEHIFFKNALKPDPLPPEVESESEPSSDTEPQLVKDKKNKHSKQEK